MWVECTNKEDGTIYYINRATGKTTHKRPANKKIVKANSDEQVHYRPEDYETDEVNIDDNVNTTTSNINDNDESGETLIDNHSNHLSESFISKNAYGDIISSPIEAVIPWHIKKIANEPCKVMCCTMGCSCFMVFLLLILMATGLIEFELDHSPDSFNVKFDDLADRYDAQRAIREKTRPSGPADFDFEMEEQLASEKKKENETYILMDDDVFAFYYEVKNGKDHIPDGGAGGNIFDEENLKEIIEFENKLLKMTKYRGATSSSEDATVAPDFCARIDDLYSKDCKGYLLSPRMFAYSTSISMKELNLPFQSCCECSGNVSDDKVAPCAPKTLIPICMYNSSNAPHVINTYNYGDGNSWVDGTWNGGSFTKNNLNGVLTSLADTLSCKEDERHPGATLLNFFFEKKYSKSNPTTSCSRSVLPLQYWMKKKVHDDFYNSLSPNLSQKKFQELEEEFWSERWREIDESLYIYSIGEMKALVDEHNADETTKVRISFFGPWIISNEIVSGILGAAQIVGIAIAIVLLYTIYHTESIFLGILGQLHVIMSFPTTWFIYRVILQYKYMGILNFISMFVIIGIGADDIFVFVDAWKQAKLEGPIVNKNLESRLNWAWARAAKAMLITSLTDAAAFYINIISIVIVVRVFGVFMGTMVIVNYMLVITWFPAVVIVYTKLWPEPRRWKPRCGDVWPCCSKIFRETQIVPLANNNENTTTTTTTTNNNNNNNNNNEGKTSNKNNTDVGDEKINGKENSDMINIIPVNKKNEIKKGNITEIFFEDYYTPTLFGDIKMRLIVAFLFMVMVGIFLAFALQIRASEKDFKAESFPSSSNLMRTLNILGRFEGEQDSQVGSFLWGMGIDGSKAVNRTGMDTNNPREFGLPVYDTNFNPYTPKAQQHVIDTCNIFRKNKHVKPDAIYKDEAGVYCFMEHFRDWVRALNETFPISEKAKLNRLMANFMNQPSKTVCDLGQYPANISGCGEYYETIKKYPATLWIGADNLHNAWNGYVRWHNVENKDIKPDIAAMFIHFNVSIFWDTGAIYARPIADSLEESMKEANGLIGTDFQGFQYIRNLYVNMRTQEIMYTASFIGAAVSGLVAFVVLSLSTMNIIMAAYAMINICFIVICCIGFMVSIGWALGTIEGICITICIGFSVDFVVHVAIAYVEADILLNRYEKTKKALGEMGISVLGATITTGMSSFIMAFCPMIPFSKIGIFILFDISVSLLFAVGLFPAMLATFGPEGNSGSIQHILCHKKCPWKRKKKKFTNKIVDARSSDDESSDAVML